jgi:hypothetical protein
LGIGDWGLGIGPNPQSIEKLINYLIYIDLKKNVIFKIIKKKK